MPRDTSEQAVTLKVVLDATPAQVWAALTTPSAIADWWGGHVSLSARPGGRFEERWTNAEGRAVVTSGKVLRADAPSSLELSWADDDWPAETSVSFHLAPFGLGRCKLSLEHRGWKAFPEARRRRLVRDHRAGWRRHLESLRTYVATADRRSIGAPAAYARMLSAHGERHRAPALQRQRPILFAHSAGLQGDREGSGHLVASLRRALGAGYDLRYPIMPDPEDPAYAPWRERLEQELATLDDGAILVGHSLGGSVLLKMLSERKPARRIAGLFLVATPFWGSEGWSWDVNEFALRKGFAAKLTRIPRVVLYHSRDDDVVPFAHLAIHARALPHAIVRELDGHGHLFENGCRELVEDIREAAR